MRLKQSQAVAACLAFAACVPAAASAASPEMTIALTADGASASRHSVAVDAEGTRTVVWRQDRGQGGPAGDLVRAARISKVTRTVWSGKGKKRKRVKVTKTVVRPLAVVDGGSQTVKEVVASTVTSGVTSVAWLLRDTEGSGVAIAAKRIDQQGAVGRAISIAPAGTAADGLRVAATPDGGAWVLWRATAGSNSWLRAMRFDSRRRVAVAAKDLMSPSGTVLDGAIVAKPDGAATVAWRNTGGATTTVRALNLSAAGKAGAELELSRSDRSAFGAPALAVAPGGRAAVAWAEASGAVSTVRTARIGATGRIGSRIDVTSTGTPAFPSIGVSADGTATVAWRAFVKPPGSGPVERIKAVRIKANATSARSALDLGPVGTETLVDNSYAPALGVGPNGVSTLAWSVVKAGDPPNTIYLKAVKLAPTGKVAASANLVPPVGPDLEHFPVIASGSDGGAGIAYLRRDVFGSPSALRFVNWF